jgi:FdhD protein
MQRPVRAVPEEVVRLRVNGRPVATWSCSPAAFEALAVGRMLGLGFIRARPDVLGLRVTREGPIHVVDAEVADAGAVSAMEDAAHRSEHGCGLRFLIDCRPARIARAASASPPDPALFPDLFRALFECSSSREGAGGHHTAALSDGEGLVHAHEEVGRHNGIDKVIGDAFLAGVDLGAHGLVTTARISGEIMEKSARAGLGWVASRSVPTTLAVEIAGAAGITIVGRAASPNAGVFRPGEAGAR